MNKITTTILISLIASMALAFDVEIYDDTTLYTIKCNNTSTLPGFGDHLSINEHGVTLQTINCFTQQVPLPPNTPVDPNVNTSDCGLEYSHLVDPVCQTWLPRDNPTLHIYSIPAVTVDYLTGNPLPIDNMFSIVRWHIIGCADKPLNTNWDSCYTEGSSMIAGHTYTYRLPFRTGNNNHNMIFEVSQALGTVAGEFTKISGVVSTTPLSHTPLDNQPGCAFGELGGSTQLSINQFDMYLTALTRCDLQPNTMYYINMWPDGVYTSSVTNTDGDRIDQSTNKNPLVLDMQDCGSNVDFPNHMCRIFIHTNTSLLGTNAFMDYSTNTQLPNYINSN